LKILLRRVFRVLGWIIAAFFIIWGLLWAYVFFNKKSIIAEVSNLINSKLKGEVKIADLEPSLISTFPMISIHLSKVLVRDSLWPKHHHDLINAQDIYVRLELFPLFSGNAVVDKIKIEKGSVYLFSDTSGYSNDYVFKNKNDTSSSPKKIIIPDIELTRMRVVVDLKHRNKLYDFDIGKLDCKIKNKEKEILFNVKTHMLVHSLAFNTANGSFIKEKPIEGKFKLQFNRASKTLVFKNVTIDVDHQPFHFTGAFNFSNPPPLYKLYIRTNNITYKEASSLLSASISEKLARFNIEKPINVVASIDGSTRPNRIPFINIEVGVKNNSLTTPIGNITNASFTAIFNNQLSKQGTRVDKNSGFLFTSVSGNWEDIALKADSMRISNLEHPVLYTDLHAEFNLKKLNDLLGSNTIEFTRGYSKMDIKYEGPMIPGDSMGASMYGNFNFMNATIKYLPRNLSFINCSGKIQFNDQDVYVKQLKAQSGNTHLLMNGGIKNLMSLIGKTPEKLILDWNISSAHLNLTDFLSYLKKRSSNASEVSAKRKFLKLANQIDRMLKDCNVDLKLTADQVTYKKFNATNVAATIQLTDKIVALKNVEVHHAGGTLNLSGSLKEEENYNSIKLNTMMNNVNIEKVFTSFNNFGQDGITDKNIKGNLTAKINITGAVTDKAEFLQDNLQGYIQINLKNGRLVDFEPVQKISETAFKKRDFSDISFAELKERLDIKGSEIKVNRMEIHSSVLTMFVEGIYDLKKGTDLSIQIPLSNLKRRDQDAELQNKGVKSKTGISLRLRAKTGENGKAKISWDPFNLAQKNRDKQTSADSSLALNNKEPLTDSLNISKNKNIKPLADSSGNSNNKKSKSVTNTVIVSKLDSAQKKNIP
jgi:hypothetical protein